MISFIKLWNENLIGQLESFFGPINPYWETPKRGRPSKAALEKRKKYIQWENENRVAPETPFIDFLVSMKPNH